MADAEEDFSQLPLPDRFVHKVSFCAPSGPYSFAWLKYHTELESQEGRLRGCCEDFRNHSRRVRSGIQTIHIRLGLMEGSRRRFQCRRATGGYQCFVFVLEIWRRSGIIEVCGAARSGASYLVTDENIDLEELRLRRS